METFLKVVVSGSMRIHNCDVCCKRWYVTFDGKESSPPIEGIVYIWKGKGTTNLHRVRVIRGHRHIPKTGQVKVDLRVGNCRERGGGDAYTGWQSTVSIFIEEVNAPQS